MTENATTEIVRRTCKDCGEFFALEPGEVEWYLRLRLTLPARCKPCREMRTFERKTRTKTT